VDGAAGAARFGRSAAFGAGAFRRGPGFLPPRAGFFAAWPRLAAFPAFAAFPVFVFAIDAP
jgi:hypothetical protein